MSKESSNSGEGAGESFWSAANKPAAKASPSGAPAKKKSLLKKLLIGGGIAVVVLIAAVLAVGPQIAGSMAPGIIESSAAKSISGRVKVEQTSFSWGGPQVVGPVEIADAAGKPIARVTIESSAGLWGLATGYLGGMIDAGQVTVTGKAAIERGADGQTNLEKALAPPAGKESTEGKDGTPAESGVIQVGELPQIRAAISAKQFDITYAQAAASGQGSSEEYVLKDFSADANVDITRGSGIKAGIDLATKIGRASAASGDVRITGKLQVPASAGAARIGDVVVDAKAIIASAPVEVLDALTLQKGKLLAGLGPTADLEMTVKGDFRNAEASVIAKTAKATADMAFTIKEGIATASKPGVLTAKGETLRELVPGIKESLAQQQTVSVAQFPDVTVDIKSLNMRIPREGDKVDLRGAALDFAVKTTAMTGQVVIDKSANAKASAFAMQPMDLRIATADLSKSAEIKLNTSATVDNRPAGNVRVDLTASNILDALGAPQAQHAALQGTVLLEKVATAVAQPFVQGMKLDLPRDVGPELDVRLTANSAPTASGKMATGIDADVQSQHVRMKAGLELAEGVLKTKGDGVTLALGSAGGIASRFVDPSTGFALAPGGQANVRIRSMSVPLPKQDAPFDLGKLAADFDATLAGLSIAPARATTPGQNIAPVEIRTLTASGKMMPGGDPTVKVNGDLQHDRQPFTLAAGMELKGLLAKVGERTEVSPKTLRPQGTIELKNVPMSVAALMRQAEPKAAAAGPAPAAPSKPMNLAGLLRGVVGPTVNIKIDSAPRGQNLDMTASVVGQNMATDVVAGVEEKALDLKKASIVTTVAPDTVQALMDVFAPTLSERPRLLQSTKATVQIAPIRIPLTESIFSGFKPDVANSPDATLTVSLPEKALVQGLAIKNEDGSKRDLGSVGVDGFQIRATFPPAALAGSAARWTKPASATMEGRILSGPNEALMVLSGTANADLSASGTEGKSPLDRLTASLKAQSIAIGAVERLAAQDAGMLTGAVGDSGNVTVNVKLDATSAGGDLAKADVAMDATVDTPRLRIPEPVKLRMGADRMGIGNPIKLTWDVDPRWANKFMEPKASPAGQPAAQSSMKLSKPATVRASVNTLAISRGQGVGPLKPGVFDIDAVVEAPAVELAASDGNTVALEGTNVKIAGGSSAKAAAGAIEAAIRIASATVSKQGSAPVSARDMTMDVTVSKLAGADGVVNTDAAIIDARGDLPVIPVPLLDVLANQDGLLTAALGPVAEASIRANQVSKNGGAIDVKAKSGRATASVAGTIQDGVFATTRPLDVTIMEVSPELTERLLKGVPLIGTISKTPQDQPGTVVGNGLKIPLSKDFSKLNGQIVVDPGEAIINSSGAFSKILKAFDGKTSGRGGKRIEPLHVDIVSGVVTYKKWALPLGEFNVTTEGKVDMVNRTLDVVTWMPIGALTDEAAGLFQAGDALTKILPGKKVLDAATTVPWRTKGTFEKNSTAPDLELFAKDFVDTIRPDELIKRGIEDLFKPKSK